MIVSIVGIGLIGGSLSIGLKESGFASHIIGVDNNKEHIDKALRRRLIDESMKLQDAIKASQLIILAIPVDAILKVLPSILDQVTDQIILDVGSTKSNIIDLIKDHPKRENYIATHPMAGTEFSGPEAAVADLFKGNCTVICNHKDSSKKARKMAKKMYKALEMSVIKMNAIDHDVHTAYVSHISHISSFALALTVLEKEKDENRIFELASGGFSSTVRLAKSSSNMWIPVFRQNRDNVLDVLDEHINSLARFRSLLIKKDFKSLEKLIKTANTIGPILANK